MRCFLPIPHLETGFTPYSGEKPAEQTFHRLVSLFD